MIDFITDNHSYVFNNAFKHTRGTVRIISPYIEKGAVNILLNAINQNNKIKCILITKFSDADFICGANNLDVLRSLVNVGVEIYAVKNLHSKLYLFDNKLAIVGSANFTTGGFLKNVELAVKFEDDANISKLREYFDDLYKSASVYKVTEEKINKKKNQLSKYIKTENNFKIPNENWGVEICKHAEEGVLKFEYENENRADAAYHYYPAKYSGFYFTSSSKNKKPRMLTAGKILFMTVFTQDKKGDKIPMIVGRAKTTGFNENFVADDAMKKIHNWTMHFSNYVKLYNIEVIDAPMADCVSLYTIFDKLGMKTFPTSNAKTPYGAYRQQSYRALSLEATKLINNLLDEKLGAYGRNEKLFIETRVENG